MTFSNEANRNHWLEQTLQALPAGQRILDAGAGELPFKRFCNHLQYVSQDVAIYDGSGDDKGLQTEKWDFGKLDYVCDIGEIPEPDAAFDAIMCTEVLEHLPDPLAALREFSRLLKVGGALIITAPFCSLTHFSPYHYATGFNRYFYEYHLQRLGFHIDELTTNGNFFSYLDQELGRLPSIVNRYTDARMPRVAALSASVLRRPLRRWSNSDDGSSELLCFGYHVRATRVVSPNS